MRHVVIIGNGIAGITAARGIRKRSDIPITVVSSESDHFYSRTALMYIYMGHMRYEDTKPYEDTFWVENRIDLLRDHVQTLDTTKRTLELASGNVLRYDILVLATGSRPNRFGWPGEDLAGVQGLYSLADLQLMEQNTREIQRAVIVGGGLIGIEVAEMLRSRQIPVTFFVREDSYWNNVLPAEESAMINREIRRHGVDLRLSTELQEVLPDRAGRVRAVRSTDGKELACQFVALTAGVRPNTDLLRGTPVEVGMGVLVNEYFETSVPGVYAAGDCAELRQSGSHQGRLEQLWYTGRQHGACVAATICGQRTAYERGVHFNSAKFFTIEYQTYGEVEGRTEGEKQLYWEHPDGRRAIRIAFRDDRVTGFNLMGVRYRHRVCEHWIAERRTLPYVLAHLAEANFDPEFSTRFETAVRSRVPVSRGTAACAVGGVHTTERGG